MKARALIFGVILGFSACVHSAEFKVDIAAPAFSSAEAVLTAEVPVGFPESGTLATNNKQVPFQRNGTNEIAFIAPLQKGIASTWTVHKGQPEGRVTTARSDGTVVFQSGDRRLLVYQGAETALPRPEIKPQFKRGGYLHPVYSPTGKIVTDDYPPNHIHHHGIWFPWTKTKFEGRSPDFWNMGQGSGKVEFARFGDHWSGPVHAGMEAHHKFVDLTSPEPKAVLNERWTVRAYALPKSVVFDLTSIQECATDAPLELPKFHYGGLGFRGNWAWNGRDQCQFLTSNGETDRVKGNETRGNWCYIGGEIAGQACGILILSHPENFRHPQPMRLHPSEPFFCFAPSQEGDWSIQPGDAYVSRYRFIVVDGLPDKARFDGYWMEYAMPPKISVATR